jgi:hypothetical protein
MAIYAIEAMDESMGYTFEYPIKAGDIVAGPYPLNEIIGANPPHEIYGESGKKDQQITYWEDHKVISNREKDEITALPGVNNSFKQAVEKLYYLSRDPDSFDQNYSVGISKVKTVDAETGNISETIMQSAAPGPGLAVVCNPYLVGPTSPYTSGYVVLAENNMTSSGSLPVALHVIKIDKNEQYRGSCQRQL